jgi:hypothetical protein
MLSGAAETPAASKMPFPDAHVAPASTSGSRGTSQSETTRIPENAIPARALESNPAWEWEHDDKTYGSAEGRSNYPISPDGHGVQGRQFVATYGDKGGERYHLTFGWDANATHFVYEANVSLGDPAQIENIEMDMNQVMADGRTVVFGTQCAAHSKTWEYTRMDSAGKRDWHSSNISCNPHAWGTKQWHKIQIASHRDDNGNVTYDWVSFDGVYTEFQDASGPSAKALRWRPGLLLLNFQFDGARNSGTMDAYVKDLTIYRW